MLVVNDIVQMVSTKLRGRSDLIRYGGKLGSDIPSWICEAILDITPNFDFEELMIAGPVVNFQVGVAEYPISYFLDPNNNSVDDVFTKVRSFFRYFSTDNPPTLGQTGNELKTRALTTISAMANIPGIPTYWCQNGQSLLFGFNPDKTYTAYMRFQRKHPFAFSTSLSGILSQQIFMPDDWREVLAYAAAIKGCEFVGMQDVGFKYYQMLHGDPKKPGNIGLLFEKRSQLARNLDRNERQMQPVVRRYC